MVGLSGLTSIADEDLGALQTCVPADADWIDVASAGADGLFQSPSGDMFYPVDISEKSGRDIFAMEHKNHDFAATALGAANRWGLRPAWIRVNSGEDISLLQAKALQEGQVIFAPDVAEGACAAALYQSERIARTAERGIWRDGKPDLIYATTSPQALEAAAGRYVIARGRIVSLGKTRRTRYLNFGTYWKQDFTVTVKATDVEAVEAALASSGWRFDELAGQAVEIRGIVQIWDGPHIELLHPEQLVVLDTKRAGRDDPNGN
ncbi:MAG: hypothetical protein ABJN98_22665 [Roseibium sp.]